MSAAQVAPLDMPDPSQPGPYEVRTLFYGSGQDHRRPEYGAGVDLVTGSVDGSPFTNGWTSIAPQLLGLRPGGAAHQWTRVVPGWRGAVPAGPDRTR